MSRSDDTERKLALAEKSTLLPLLEPETRGFLHGLARSLRLSFQEIRRLAEAARDLEMWREEHLPALWRRIEESERSPAAGPMRKKRLLDALERRMGELRRRPKEYPAEGLDHPQRAPLAVVEQESDKKIVGDCPVASGETVCCQLRTIDAVENCAYACSYCIIQTFYGREAVVDARLGEKLRAIQLDPDRFYHFGTGQSSDSLVWGNRAGMLDALCEFAASHPNILLELKTKSANVAYFMDRMPPPNVACSWSLNTGTIIRSEEHFTAGLDERLAAARKVADRGVKVALHFHPIVHYSGWEEEYAQLARRVQAELDPEDVLFVSFGSVTFIKPVMRRIR
ncbi:MAG: DNA photolyase, partial [Planctomycetes bacterium]|nr:DNA photolyase [Planctomycetota bacterium]